MTRLMHNHKGAVMSEAIVAMAIIIIISITALGFLTRFATNSAKMINRNEAIKIIENTMECFQYADNKADFDLWVARYARINYEITDRTAYSYQGNGYMITLNVSYGAEFATFMATARETSGKAILVISRFTRYYS